MLESQVSWCDIDLSYTTVQTNFAMQTGIRGVASTRPEPPLEVEINRRT